MWVLVEKELVVFVVLVEGLLELLIEMIGKWWLMVECILMVDVVL